MHEFFQCLRVTHDEDVDAAYLDMRQQGSPTAAGAVGTVPVVLPESVPGSVLLDFDTDGRLLGIEILGAAAVLPEQFLSFGPPLPPGAPRYVRWNPRPWMADIDLVVGAVGKVTDWHPTAVQVSWIGREADLVTRGAVYDAEDLEPFEPPTA